MRRAIGLLVSDSGLLTKLKDNTKKVNIGRHNFTKRNSRYDPNANRLIQCVKEKNYNEAKCLIMDRHVDIDSHDMLENTPLTDAAERGDLDGVRFLLRHGANPYASCDCPYHKTAFHYASENGHIDVLKELSRYGDPDAAEDSRGYRPSDIAKNNYVKHFLRNKTPELSSGNDILKISDK